MGDNYLDLTGYILTINEIDIEGNTIYLDDIDKRYGDWKGKGAIFTLSDFKTGMQLILNEPK